VRIAEPILLRLLPLAQEHRKAQLVEPKGSGYLFLAAEIDAHPPFLWNSRTKRRLIEDCVGSSARIAREPGVLEAVTFEALLVAPIGEAAFLRRRRDEVHRARFDLAVLIETDSVDTAQALHRSPLFRALETHVRDEAGHVYVVTAGNVKRIGAVDHTREASSSSTTSTPIRRRRTSPSGNTRRAGSSRKPGSTTPPSSCRRRPTSRSTR
jgi:hypothetical protein